MSNIIPSSITRQNLLDAIDDFNAGAPHDFADSTGYDLVYQGLKYPPKAIVGLASVHAGGPLLGPYDFKGGVGTKCFRILRENGFEIKPKTVVSEYVRDWSDAELRGSIEAYTNMLEAHRSGEPFVKTEYYEDLISLFGRTKGSFEYRMQNISHVLALQGRNWLPGLPPAKNVGVNIIARIENILAEIEGTPSTGRAQFEAAVSQARQKGTTQKPAGNSNPKKTTTESSSYARDPDVKAWVLENANGTCESCNTEAPFLNHEGKPFLEVHHVIRLADGGPDVIENAVALCPNCHKAFHYSQERARIVTALYKLVHRLK